MDYKLSGAMVSLMNGEKKLNYDERSEQKLLGQIQLDILKVMQQCGIQHDSFEQYLHKRNKSNNNN